MSKKIYPSCCGTKPHGWDYTKNEPLRLIDEDEKEISCPGFGEKINGWDYEKNQPLRSVTAGIVFDD